MATRKSLFLPLSLIAVAACSQGSAMSAELRADLEAARAETPELATRAHNHQQIISAQELAPMGVPQPAPAPRRSTTPTRRAPVPTPAPVANATEVGTVAAAEEVAVAPAAAEPAPTPATEAPAPDIVVSERPEAPPMVIPGDGGGMRGGRGSGSGGGGTIVIIRGGRGDVDHCPPPGRRGRGSGVGVVIGGGRSGPGVLINDRVPRSRGPSLRVPGGTIGVGFP